MPDLAIHAREVALYARCPRRYKLAEVEKIPGTRNLDTILSNALRRAVRNILANKTIVTEDREGPDECLAFFEASFIEAVSTLDSWQSRAIDQGISEGKRFLSQFIHLEMPALNIQKLDQVFTRDCRTMSYDETPRIPITITAEVSVVEPSAVGFFRLSHQDANRKALGGDLELILGALAADSPNAWVMVFNRANGTICRHGLLVKGSLAQWGLELAVAAAEGIKAGAFQPCAPECWWCGSTTCAWWKVCRGRKPAEEKESWA